MLWIDVTDVVDHLQTNKSVNGIQRAVLDTIDELLPRAPNARLVSFDERTLAFREVSILELRQFGSIARLKSSSLVKRLIPLMPAVARRPTRAILRRLTHYKRPREKARFSAGDTFLLMGAFWHHHRHSNRVIDAIFSSRVKLALFIHDLIPLTHQHWFPPRQVIEWKDQLDSLLRIADHVLANSQATANVVSNYLAANGMPRRFVAAVRFGEPLPRVSEAQETIIVSPHKPFALMVSSIDVRKNQKSLLFVWRRLISELGDQAPNLVLVGKNGTESGVIHSILAESPSLKGRVIIDHDADDARLIEYYNGCLFTLFPSYAEGWGFPIAESLMFNKACIASKLPSSMEVGGDLCRYVDPHNLQELYAATKEFITGDTRSKFEERIRGQFMRHGWGETAEQILNLLNERPAQVHNFERLSSAKKMHPN